MMWRERERESHGSCCDGGISCERVNVVGPLFIMFIINLGDGVT